jgi:hypothetical protein
MEKSHPFKATLWILFVIVMTFLGMELATRSHHYLKFGILQPLHEQAVFYDARVLEYSKKTGKPAPPTVESYSDEMIIFSGGSVAYGFGSPRESSPSKKIAFHMGSKVFDMSFPGKSLKQELEDLGKLKLFNKRVVLLSGFNDIYGIQTLNDLQNARKKIFSAVSFLQYSLFFQKSFQRLFLWHARREWNFAQICEGIRAQLKQLERTQKKLKFNFFLQPIISPEKILAGSESRILRRYAASFKEGLFERRKQLEFLLKEFRWIEIVDLQQAFEGSSQELFIDICHLNQKGNSLLASEIAQKIKPIRKTN